MGMFCCFVMCLLLEATKAEARAISSDYATSANRDFRSRRGFRTVGLATARGFGKRSSNAGRDDDANQDQER